jgi:hypothetical protein
MGGFSRNFIFEYFAKICQENSSLNLTRITGALHVDLCTIMVASRPSILKMRSVSGKSFRENGTTHFSFVTFFLRKPYLYEIMWKSMVEPGRTQTKVWRMLSACWISKATDTLP